MNIISSYCNFKFLVGLSLWIITINISILLLLSVGIYLQWNLLSVVYIGHVTTGLLAIPFLGFLLILFHDYKYALLKKHH